MVVQVMVCAAKLIRIQIVDPRQPEFRAMLLDSENYMASLYPAQSNHILDIETLCQPQMLFFGAFVDDVAQGCGGYWNHDGYVEIKRLWVSPSARGLGLGHQLLDHFEAAARAKGAALARLETGISQPEATALYEKCGYDYITPFGDYRPDPLSLFMEKAL